MNTARRFNPTRRTGIIFQGVVLLVLLGLISFCYWYALQQYSRGLLFLFLIGGSLLLVPLVIAGYRLYALLTASYEIDRDRLSIRWGLRLEEIPLPEIEWIRPMDELGEELRRPILSAPGAYLGSVKSPNLGPIEFMASNWQDAVVVAAQKSIVVISPEKPGDFVRTFQNAAEMGSLESPEVHSSHPGALVSQVLKDRLSLGLLIGLTVTIVVLAIMDGLLVLGRQTISLGFAPNGSLLEPVPSSYLLLLPILGLIVFFGDTGMGLYFFTRRNLKLASYALWIAGIVTLLMLMLASLTFYFASG